MQTKLKQQNQRTNFLKQQAQFQKKLIKKLIAFHEATLTALQLQKQGHSKGWTKVQELADEIEDEFDLTAI